MINMNEKFPTFPGMPAMPGLPPMPDMTAVMQEMQSGMHSFMDAMNRSVAACWQGMEDMSRNISGIMQESFARHSSACAGMMKASTPQEAAEMHSGYMRDCFDGLVSSTGKMSEIAIRSAKQAADPITSHANDALSKMMKKTAV